MRSKSSRGNWSRDGATAVSLVSRSDPAVTVATVSICPRFPIRLIDIMQSRLFFETVLGTIKVTGWFVRAAVARLELEIQGTRG